MNASVHSIYIFSRMHPYENKHPSIHPPIHPSVHPPTSHPTHTPPPHPPQKAAAQNRELERAKASLQEEASKAHILAAAAATTTTTTTITSGGLLITVAGFVGGWVHAATYPCQAMAIHKSCACNLFRAPSPPSFLPNSPTPSQPPLIPGTTTDNTNKVPLSQLLPPELSCALCSSLLVDAAVLPCSHAFCFACLHPRLTSQENAASSCSCPICRCGSGLPLGPFLGGRLVLLIGNRTSASHHVCTHTYTYTPTPTRIYHTQRPPPPRRPPLPLQPPGHRRLHRRRGPPAPRAG